MFLNDLEIRKEVMRNALVSPFKDYGEGTQAKPSSGLSCCGYDMTLGNEFKGIHPDHNGPIDPRNPPGENAYQSLYIKDGQHFVLQPKQFVLACTKEYVKVPPTLVAFLMDKSTLARFGVFLFNTIFEPGWEGLPTLEIVNFNSVPILLHPGMGICQFIFSTINKPIKDYLEKSGKYQKQTGVTVAR